MSSPAAASPSGVDVAEAGSTEAGSSCSGRTLQSHESRESCDLHAPREEDSAEQQQGLASEALPTPDSSFGSSSLVLNALLASAKPPVSELGGTCRALAAELLMVASPSRSQQGDRGHCLSGRPVPPALGMSFALGGSLPSVAEDDSCPPAPKAARGVQQKEPSPASERLVATEPLPPLSQPTSPGVLEVEAALQECSAQWEQAEQRTTQELLAVEVRSGGPPSFGGSSAPTPRGTASMAATQIQALVRGHLARSEALRSAAGEVNELRWVVRGLVALGVTQRATLMVQLRQAEAEAARPRGISADWVPPTTVG